VLKAREGGKGIDKGLTAHGTPANQRNNNPHQIRIPVQTRTLEQVRTLTPVPLEHGPKPHRHRSRISIHQPSRPAQQLEIIFEFPHALLRKVLINRACQEQDDNDGRRDPHGAVEIRVPLEDVEEVCARINGRCTAAEDFVCVDIKGLRVEGERPEVVFARCGRGCRGAGEER
jgi:hypothetical protein